MKAKTLLSLFALLLSWMPASAFAELAGWTRGNVAIADGRGMGGAGTDRLSAETFSGAPVAGVMADPSMESEGVGADPVLSAEGSTVPQAADPGGWVRKYPPQPRDVSAGASDVAVDGAGNVYITGWIGTGVLTVKYDNAGKLQWARRFAGEGGAAGRCIAVDASGNVYVAGCIGSTPAVDIVAIKYSPDGVHQWARYYNGPTNQVDWAAAMAVDGSGNVYVTGVADQVAPGNSYVVTLKYSGNGELYWASRHKGYISGGDASRRSMALDAAGNVYVVAGHTLGENPSFFLLKYGTDGRLRWKRRYGGVPEIKWCVGFAVAVDDAGNAYVCGLTVRWDDETKYLIHKYRANGTRQWERTPRFEPCTGTCWASIAVDGSGNVYVVDISRGNDLLCGFSTSKYDSNGDRQWKRRIHESTEDHSTSDWPAIAVDGPGAVYVTGGLSGQSIGSDIAAAKYDADGHLQWSKRYDGTGRHDTPSGIAFDAAGNAFVTGISYRTDAIFEAVTIKIPTDGGN
ncbi:SBBP repeat-containing protein [Syntrophobacter fumaroxidans]|uniref:Uncharacterized protein n=1 Tax=Syntrophobacter fumaroxidans (strain DSM 10017 / MPOB) TaxID=335543 RepID=A0LLJ1_SYNFM|nr:SBBP repeat-containing protein [Syntrophobacter fumaroxidans]ABK18293.1 hypothetical protein Sfum_2615 [Syntrophobacter fumaroxidans MPOB]